MDSSGKEAKITFDNTPPYMIVCSKHFHQDTTPAPEMEGPVNPSPSPGTVHTGALTECYDELGNRYQLPVYCLSSPVNMIEEKSELETIEIPEAPASEGQECQLRLRLSTGRDLRLAVCTNDNVQQMKHRLQTQEGVVATSQRWFFSGRPLTDKMKLEELKISREYVVQVIISQPPTTQPLQQNPTPVEN
ncbi:ubiquitin domain-containing protein 2-like [Carassius auratus]|uniref:Ubiquitin domain-containing protein 2-like n=1 Tax=Carassius auratus TaxID=7957 RepID=A0A6P6JT07_CARAU|nr:ubiquitin domain-containing protein 2-like [Carassius auratus]